MVRRVRPDAVINCSAYTDVDRAEDEPIEALEVNAFAVKRLADASRRGGGRLRPLQHRLRLRRSRRPALRRRGRTESRSTYACSKLIGEWFARDAGAHYVLRVESVFDSWPPSSNPRRTSVDRILDSILEGREARVFADRTVSPSSCRDVAWATRSMLERRPPSGLYHCVNSGSCTWEELAREAARQLGVEPRLALARMADAKLRAERPLLLRALERQTCRGRHRDGQLAGRDQPLSGGPPGGARPFLTTSRGEPYNSNSPAHTPPQEAHVEARHHHRHHRAGRIVPRRTAARQRLRSHGDRQTLERAEPVENRAPARPHDAPARRICSTSCR